MRAIAVPQTRGSAHDPLVRQVRIDRAGMRIGERVPDARSLPGLPSAAEEAPPASAPRSQHRPPDG